MKRVHELNGLEFLLESLSECVVEVSYQEQTGWFGVNLDGDTDENSFTWTTNSDECTADGIIGGTVSASPDQALEELANKLVAAQEEVDAERARDPRNRLGALLEALPGAVADKKDSGWRRLGRRGLDRLKQGGEVLGDRATQGGATLRGRMSQGKDALQHRVSQGKDALQDQVTKMNLPDRRRLLGEIVSPSKVCEREGHIFDDIKLIGRTDNVTRFCRRCRQAVLVKTAGPDEEQSSE